MKWTMADFAFQKCPIFLVEIFGEKDGNVFFSPLHCFTKEGLTILAASNKPGATNPKDLLPPTKHVEWVWRTKKNKQDWKGKTLL